MSYKVAIIGAGSSGLTAVKCCLEEGLVPLCFEKNDFIGGLWHFTGKVSDGRATATKSTLTNQSKEMMAFSDFSMPKDYPPFLHHWHLDEYFNMYADKFDLRKYISLKTEVVRVEETKDHAVSGQWVVTVKHVQTGMVVSHSVNAVMLCTGPFAKPFMPIYDGIQDFQGKVLHSYEYLEPTGYEGKIVVVVGFGNTAVDIATELSRTAKKVYLSTRRGGWAVSRLGPSGTPFDMNFNRITGFLRYHFPNLFDRIFEKSLSEKLDHHRYGLFPQTSPCKSSVFVSDDIPVCLIQGSIQIAKEVSHVNGNTVQFTDGSSVENVDVIIMATGYRTFCPFLDKRIFGYDVTNLYKAIFPPDRQNPTLAMIGYYFLPGPNPPCAEMQSRVATRVFKGLVKLPSEKEMVKEIHRRKHNATTYRVARKVHTIQLDWIPYMNDVAPMIGVQPNIFWLLLTDWRLGLQCLFGACTPYQFRLRGPGKWKGAREALMTQMDRTFYSLDHGVTRVTKKKSVLRRVILWSLPMLAIYFGYKNIIPLLKSHTYCQR